jgi:putative ABC transport system permease protein
MSWRDAAAMALRHGQRRLGRVVLTVVAVALAAALLSALLIAVGVARGRVLSAVSKGGPLTGIEVFPNTADASQLDSDAAHLGAPRVLDDAVVRRMGRLADVTAVAPLKSTPVVVIPPPGSARRSQSAPFRDALTGADLQHASRLPITVLAGRLPGNASLHEVAVTESYLRLVGLPDSDRLRVIGTEVEIGAPRIFDEAGGVAIRERWTRSLIVGVVAAQGLSGHVIGSLAQVQAAHRWSAASTVPPGRGLADFARDLAGTSPYNLLFVDTRGLDTVGTVRAAITRLGYSSSAPESLISSVDRYTNVVEIVLSAIGLIALGIAALGIANAMMAAVRERRPDIGVLKAIGARDRDVRRLFLVEAASLGAVGGAIGTVLGYLIARLVGLAVNHYLTGQHLAGVHVGLPILVVLIGIGGSTAVALVAGTAPAQRAARIPARQAMAAP